MGWLSDGINILTGKKARDEAIESQTRGATEAMQTLSSIYNQQVQDLEPFRGTGMRALAGLESNQIMDGWKPDPNYDFRMSEGVKAINASASARGNINSGANLKAKTRFGQNQASQAYNQGYNREYGRLSQLAGLGTNLNNQLSDLTGQYGQNVSNIQTGMQNAITSANIAQQNQQAGLAGQVVTAGALVFSDKRLKKNIKELNSITLEHDFSEMLSELKPYSFDYISEQYGKGNQIGVMAQDLEKSKLGKTLIIEDDKGNKQIDIGKAVSLVFAFMATGANNDIE